MAPIGGMIGLRPTDLRSVRGTAGEVAVEEQARELAAGAEEGMCLLDIRGALGRVEGAEEGLFDAAS
ncbi:MAG TPA: hypothetical protein VGM89_15455 [Puia sp.]